MAAEKKPFTRLPTNLVPRNYTLELTPDLEKFTFLGKLDITVEVCVISELRFRCLLGQLSYEICSSQFG